MLVRMSWEGRMELTKEQKNTADANYKEQYRRLREFLKEESFTPQGASSFIRINQLDVIESIYIQKDMYGRKFFTVSVSIQPLCNPSTSCFGHGQRLPSFFLSEGDPWYDYLAPKACEHSFNEVMAQLRQYVLPWFASLHSADKLQEYLSLRWGAPEIICGLYLAVKAGCPNWFDVWQKRWEAHMEQFGYTFETALQSTTGGTKYFAQNVQKILQWRDSAEIKKLIREQEAQNAIAWKLPKKLAAPYIETDNIIAL